MEPKKSSTKAYKSMTPHPFFICLLHEESIGLAISYVDTVHNAILTTGEDDMGRIVKEGNLIGGALKEIRFTHEHEIGTFT